MQPTPEKTTSGQNEPEDESNRLDPESQREFRERVTKLAFGGDENKFNEFVQTLSDGTPDGVEVILRGSAVMGHKWHHPEEPFDHDGPGTSDLDVTFVGGDMVMLFRDFHIPGIHSAPLSEEHPFAAPSLGPLRQRLCEMVGRPVNLQATTSLVQQARDVFMDQPYLVLIDKRDAEKSDNH
ncbi:MAG TPA: hypothetical protein VM099_04820 [Gemmatimonadaceae bacterium]|nr:hypothetical protein [Gemmatimonadaceae bacterium]